MREDIARTSEFAAAPAPASAQERAAFARAVEPAAPVAGGHPAAVRCVLTYGTFDLLHYGHIRFLQRAAALGDRLIVALSTDEFNEGKGKRSFYPYAVRKEMLEALRCVDLVIPEKCWEQKRADVAEHRVDVVCMGDDWAGSERFELLRDLCEVVYLERTPGISTTDVRSRLAMGDRCR